MTWLKKSRLAGGSDRRRMKTTVLLIFFLVFILMAIGLPEFGHNVGDVSQYYLANSITDTGALSAVGAIVWSYRGYDTLGEVIVLLTAVIGIMLLLKEEV